MGCYDIIRGWCPQCGYRVEFQSKGGDCTLTVYDVRTRIPVGVVAGTGDVRCLHCEARLYVKATALCSVEVRT